MVSSSGLNFGETSSPGEFDTGEAMPSALGTIHTLLVYTQQMLVELTSGYRSIPAWGATSAKVLGTPRASSSSAAKRKGRDGVFHLV